MKPLDWFVSVYGKLPGAIEENFTNNETFYSSEKAVERLNWEG